MAGYVDMTYVKLVSSMPAADIDLVEAAYPGVFAQLSEAVSRLFDSKLTKRYDVPFIASVPEALKWNVALVLGAYLWRKRGYNPGADGVDALIEKDKDEGMAWLQAAADSKDGLVELPLRQESPNSIAATKARPISYNEQSPFVWMTGQRLAGRNDDRNGSGV